MDLEDLANALHEVAGARLIPGLRPAIVAHHNNVRLSDVERFMPEPFRKKASNTLFDPHSFSNYLKRFAEPETVIFADKPNRRAVAEIDYHAAVLNDASDDTPGASWRTHLVTFAPRLDEAYAQWRAHDGREMVQKTLLEFLEDRAEDVQTPAAASLSEMVMEFQAVRKVTFKSTQRLRDNLRAFSYTEEDQSQGQAVLPEHLTLFLPIFARQEPQPIKVALRYRIDDGGLRFRLRTLHC